MGKHLRAVTYRRHFCSHGSDTRTYSVLRGGRGTHTQRQGEKPENNSCVAWVVGGGASATLSPLRHAQADLAFPFLEGPGGPRNLF
jgi:hypothetical protein